jgi:nickel/cobalt transporter (NicO) family protein
MRHLLLSLLAALLFAFPVLAHPVPKTNRDRTIVVRVLADGLVVDYRLELDEGSIPNELTREEAAKITTRTELLETFCRSFAETACRNLDASLDGKELQFKCIQRKFTATDHVRCDYRFLAPWSLKPGVEHKVKFHECNYVVDDFSRVNLYLTADDSVRILSGKAPDAELMSRGSDQRKPGDSDKLRRAEAQIRLANTEPKSAYKPAFPPDDLQYKDEPDNRAATVKASPAEAVAVSKSPPREVQDVSWPVPPELPNASGESSISEPSSWWQRIRDPNALQHLLLESREGLALLLVFAALAGAAHAFTPGHGKTAVAAYLVGSRGTYWHALVLGLVTTLTHTSVVIVLAGVVRLLPGSEFLLLKLQGVVGGFVFIGLGLWLFVRRVSGQADHFHLGGGHHHHHGPAHSHDHDDHYHDEHGLAIARAVRKNGGLGEVVMLGMGGGLLPCWDALFLLGFAITTGQAHLALPLILAFSAGLATVLVLLGIAVVGAKSVAERAAPSSSSVQALTRALPIFSALVVTLMGFWLCYGALAAK